MLHVLMDDLARFTARKLQVNYLCVCVLVYNMVYIMVFRFHTLIYSKLHGLLPDISRYHRKVRHMFIVLTNYILSGWWFGTFFIFPSIGNNHPN